MGRRGAQLDGEFAFHAPRRQLRAWPGWGGGGVRCLGVELAFLSFTHWPPRREAKLVPLMEREIPAPLLYELNLLGRSCGAGCVNKENAIMKL